jgi:ribosome-binding protein aMBF1 (putative translation factor)
MKCQRCGKEREAEYQVVSDAMKIAVCAECAKEARRIGMSLEVVEIDKSINQRTARNVEARV